MLFRHPQFLKIIWFTTVLTHEGKAKFFKLWKYLLTSQLPTQVLLLPSHISSTLSLSHFFWCTTPAFVSHLFILPVNVQCKISAKWNHTFCKSQVFMTSMKMTLEKWLKTYTDPWKLRMQYRSRLINNKTKKKKRKLMMTD